MASNKELRLEQAQESLTAAQRMLSRYEGTVVGSSDVSRIQDVAALATQAAAQLNQLIGLLLADRDTAR